MKYILLLLNCIILFSCTQEKNKPVASTTYDIRDYGAKPDGKTINTSFIQKAIDLASENGGGKVVVAGGTFISGSIFIKDNVELEVLHGATILGSSDTSDYAVLTWGHNRDRQPRHLIIGLNAKNIAITGGGIIDGNGPEFWEDYDPKNDPQWIMAKPTKISPMLEIQGCSDVRIKDITLKTGGGWTCHLYNSERIQVQGAKILNNVYAPNGDGIDISGCTDVTISDCIIKTCDDAICLKTMVDTKECKRITVNNCIIECFCAALKIGNETFRDIRQVTFSNCIIYNSSRAFAIYAESAGTIEDIIVSNIIHDSKAPLIYNRPIHLSLYLPKPGAGERNGDWLLKDKKQWDYEGREPILRNITITNFTSKTDGRILIAAENGRKIENLTMQNINLTYPFIEDPEPNILKAKSSQFSPNNPEAKKAKASIVVENVKNFVLDNVVINWPTSDTVPSDWAFKKRIANGTLEAFYPDYSNSRQCEMNALWLKGIDKGYINIPLAQASSKELKKIESIASDFILAK